MYTFHHLRRSIIVVIAVCVLVLIAAASAFIFTNRDERLRYAQVKDVTIAIEYPPFTSFHLSNAEINILLDQLSSINFAEEETVSCVVEGDGITCTIFTDSDTHTIYFLRPYCFIDEEEYMLDGNMDIFQTVEQLIQTIMGPEGLDSGPQRLLMKVG